MTDTKWCESWEKNFDSTFKSLNKFKEDLKQKPLNLNYKTHNRCRLYIELLIIELEEMKENFGEVAVNQGKDIEEQVGTY